jgi:hypothetical protein
VCINSKVPDQPSPSFQINDAGIEWFLHYGTLLGAIRYIFDKI